MAHRLRNCACRSIRVPSGLIVYCAHLPFIQAAAKVQNPPETPAACTTTAPLATLAAGSFSLFPDWCGDALAPNRAPVQVVQVGRAVLNQKHNRSFGKQFRPPEAHKRPSGRYTRTLTSVFRARAAGGLSSDFPRFILRRIQPWPCRHACFSPFTRPLLAGARDRPCSLWRRSHCRQGRAFSDGTAPPVPPV